MRQLSNVTLLGIDCVNVERLQKALDISSREIKFADVKLLTSLPTDDLRRVEIPHIGSIEAFSEFCIRDLHKYVQTEFALLVQYDGFVINPSSWRDEFLKYDYIGAPWLVTDWSIKTHDFPRDYFNTLVVGNGGFSLRSKRLLEVSSRLAENGILSRLHPEDVSICVWNREFFEEEGIRFAPVDLALKFSIEDDNKYPYTGQFGFHDYRHTLKRAYLQRLLKQHSEWGLK